VAEVLVLPDWSGLLLRSGREYQQRHEQRQREISMWAVGAKPAVLNQTGGGDWCDRSGSALGNTQSAINVVRRDTFSGRDDRFPRAGRRRCLRWQWRNRQHTGARAT